MFPFSDWNSNHNAWTVYRRFGKIQNNVDPITLIPIVNPSKLGRSTIIETYLLIGLGENLTSLNTVQPGESVSRTRRLLKKVCNFQSINAIFMINRSKSMKFPSNSVPENIRL